MKEIEIHQCPQCGNFGENCRCTSVPVPGADPAREAHERDLLLLKERRCILDAERQATLQRFNRLDGGVMELDYMIAQLEAIFAASGTENENG